MSVLPGLWEAHGHLFHVGEADPGAFQVKFADQLVPIMEAVARVTVESGVTAMRDFCTSCSSQAAGWNSALLEDQKKLRQRILAGEIPGPRLYFSGPALAPGSGKPASRLRRCNGAGSDGRDAQARRRGRRQYLHRLACVAGAAARCDRGSRARKQARSGRRGASHRCTPRVLDAGVDRVHVFFTADALAGYDSEELRQLVATRARGSSARCRCGRRT